MFLFNYFSTQSDQDQTDISTPIYRSINKYPLDTEYAKQINAAISDLNEEALTKLISDNHKNLNDPIDEVNHTQHNIYK